MNIEELDILKELSKQTYFGDLLFSYYADLIGKLLTAYEKEKEKNNILLQCLKDSQDILLQCLKDSQERCENEHLFLGNPNM